MEPLEPYLNDLLFVSGSAHFLGEVEGGFYLEFLAPLVGGKVERGRRRDATVAVAGVTAQPIGGLIRSISGQSRSMVGSHSTDQPRESTDQRR